MNQKRRHFAAIAIILCLSLLLGVAVVEFWGFLDRIFHPVDYGQIISKYSEEYNIPEYVIYAVIKVESNFDPDAKSRSGAMGLMQMTSDTFRWLTSSEHLDEGLGVSMLYDPEVNIRYGTYYLNYLYKKFDYNWDTAFAAYNGGEGRVAEWLSNSKYTDGEGNLTDIPIKETRNYVIKVNREIDIYKKLYYS